MHLYGRDIDVCTHELEKQLGAVEGDLQQLRLSCGDLRAEQVRGLCPCCASSVRHGRHRVQHCTGRSTRLLHFLGPTSCALFHA